MVLSAVKQRPASILSASLSWIDSLVIIDEKVCKIIFANVLIVIQRRPFGKIELREIWSRLSGTGFLFRSTGAFRLAIIVLIMMRLGGGRAAVSEQPLSSSCSTRSFKVYNSFEMSLNYADCGIISAGGFSGLSFLVRSSVFLPEVEGTASARDSLSYWAV